MRAYVLQEPLAVSRLPLLSVLYYLLVTGGAAKSIQSINVAAVVAVAAAAAVAGLASPAATHGMNKLHERNKTALFSSFFHFFEQPSLFSPCPCPP